MLSRKPLKDLIRDASGNLIETQGVSLPEQEEAGGAPVSPLMAQIGGANPDQAKMAGSAATVNRAPAIPPSESLQEVMKQEDYALTTKGPSQEQVDKQAKGAEMTRKYGEMGSRIQAVIDGGGFLATGNITATLDKAETSTLTPEQLTAVTEFASGDQGPEAIVKAKKLLGGLDPFKFLSKNSDAGSSAAGAASDKLFLTTEMITSLGSTPEELSVLLGIPADQLAGKSVEDMQAAIEAQLQQEFSSIDMIKGQLNDPSLGPNERAELIKQLRGMGASGVFATEQEMSNLEAEIEGASTIEFMGEKMTLAELLDDEFISQKSAEYVNAPEDSPAKKKMREEEPALAAWLDKHEKAFKDLSDHLDTAASDFGNIQASHEAGKATLDNLVQGNPELATALAGALGIGADGLASESFSPAKYPGLAHLTAAMAGGKLTPTILAEKFGKLAPSLVKELLEMTPEQLDKFELDKNPSPHFNKFIKEAANWDVISKLDPKKPDDISKLLLGVPMTKLAQMLREAQGYAGMGASPAYYEKLKSIIDADGDFKPDSPEKILAAMKKRMGDGDFLTSPEKMTSRGTLMDIVGNAKKSTSHSDEAEAFYTLSGTVQQKLKAGTPITFADLKTDTHSTQKPKNLSFLLNSPLLPEPEKVKLRDHISFFNTEVDTRAYLKKNGFEADLTGALRLIKQGFMPRDVPNTPEGKRAYAEKLKKLRSTLSTEIKGASGKAKEYLLGVQAQAVEMYNKLTGYSITE